MKIKINNFIKAFNFENILIVFGILVSKSLYYETFGQNVLLIFMLGLVCLLGLYRALNNRLSISRKKILLYLLILLVIFIHPDKALSTTLVFTTLLTISLLFTSVIPLSRFTAIFYKFTKFLMIASLFRYLIIYAGIPSFLPDFVSIINNPYTNFVFFGILESQGTFYGILRNNGLWWEPGAFQVIINLAFLLGLVFNKVSKRDYFIFLIVILSTFSTAGIAIFSILSLVYFQNSVNYKVALLFISLMGPVFAFSSYYQNVIDSKLSLDNASTNSRYKDLTLELRMFSEYPIIGSGLGNTEIVEEYKARYGYGTGSNGILLLLRNLGLFSILIFIPVFYPGYIKKFDKKGKFLVSTALILIFFTQNFTAILIFPLLTFYGATNYRSSLKADNSQILK